MRPHFVDGDALMPSSQAVIDVTDPSDGIVFDQIARGDAADVDHAVRAARRAADGAWGRMTATERGRRLQKIAVRLADHADELTAIESKDCGKPTKQARADAIAVARYFEFYAGAADKLHGESIPYQDGMTVFTLREPHGVTGHVVPWNYPMQIFGRSVGGALAAGNACVVKPAEDACLSLLRIAELAADLLPRGALNIVTGFGHEAGDALARHPDLDHLSFTGSPDIGRVVTRAAAEHHTPVTLELGGKSPQIVFADADLDAALPVIVNGIVQNAGQTCSAGSRLLVERSVYEEVLARLAERFAALRVGPATMDLDCGPLIRGTQRERVHAFLADAERDGIATVAAGAIAAEAPAGGYYQAPVLLRDVPVRHRLAQDEVFGPVLSAMPFDDEADAIRLANATRFGLVAGVWTRDGGRQLRMARAIRSGQVFINNYGAGGGIELPFGGIGASGHGREKGFEALYGFTTLKTIAIRHD